jgi:hypothetical protein
LSITALPVLPVSLKLVWSPWYEYFLRISCSLVRLFNVQVLATVTWQNFIIWLSSSI